MGVEQLGRGLPEKTIMIIVSELFLPPGWCGRILPACAPHGPRPARAPFVGLPTVHSHRVSAAVFRAALHLSCQRRGGCGARQPRQRWRRHHVPEPHADPRARDGLQRGRPGHPRCRHPQGAPAGVCGRGQAGPLAVHGHGAPWALGLPGPPAQRLRALPGADVQWLPRGHHHRLPHAGGGARGLERRGGHLHVLPQRWRDLHLGLLCGRQGLLCHGLHGRGRALRGARGELFTAAGCAG